MSQFNPDKLYVEYLDGVTATKPIIPRRYTLTHSDQTGELFLTLGMQFAWQKINPMRDEVLAEWISYGQSCYYSVYLYVDQGDFTYEESEKRNEIFRRELPLALTAIGYGDRYFFQAYPMLNQAAIIVNFMSVYPSFAKQEYWGSFYHYISGI